MNSATASGLALFGGKLQQFWRHWPALAPLIAVAILALLFLTAPQVYHAVLEAWLVQYHAPPFLDAGGITSAIECERRGFDTYLENPCDPLERPLVYPPIWKLGSLFPITYVGWTYGHDMKILVLQGKENEPTEQTTQVAMMCQTRPRPSGENNMTNFYEKKRNTKSTRQRFSTSC